MVCDSCGQGEAVVHLTQVVDNQMTTSHLCEQCAAAKGLDTAEGQPNFALTDFLAQMDKAPEQDASLEATCGFCGLTLAAFRETGRLGCSHCYATFDSHLRGVLRRIHGGTQHVGKVYLPSDPTVFERAKRAEGLRGRLRRAVESEDFERAAELRDLIRTLDPS